MPGLPTLLTLRNYGKTREGALEHITETNLCVSDREIYVCWLQRTEKVHKYYTMICLQPYVNSRHLELNIYSKFWNIKYT